jgi:hypothetical protein
MHRTVKPRSHHLQARLVQGRYGWGLYQLVTPDFLWSFHDGVAVTKSLQGSDASVAHLAEQKHTSRHNIFRTSSIITPATSAS